MSFILTYIKRTRWKLILMSFILGLIAISVYVSKFEMRAHLLEIYFLHLDRGRSVFIRTPANKTILIDGGQNSQIIREITKILPFYRRRIDLVILTNPLPKSAGGLVEVVDRYDLGKVIEPSLMGTSTALSAFIKSVKKKKIEVEKVKKGDSFDFDGVKFDVLFPDPLFKFNKTSTPEMVLYISYGSTSILLLGDVSKTIQKSFVKELGKTNIVEYAHSASDSRVSADLFDKINPDFIIKNEKNSKTIHFVSDGEKIEIK